MLLRAHRVIEYPILIGQRQLWSKLAGGRLWPLWIALHKADYAKLAIMQRQESKHAPTVGRVQKTHFAFFA